MTLGRKARDKRPRVKPVERIALPEGNTALRAAAAVVFLVIGVTLLIYAASRLFAVDPGWQTIEAGASEGTTCGDEFVFSYELGAGEASAAAESRGLKAVYTAACRKAYQLFHTLESFEGVVNLREINLHPNETLTVDEGLYRAFETVQRSGERTLYLGPVYARFENVFSCIDDAQLVEFDPQASEDVRREYEAMAGYARDPEAVNLRLLGDNQVCLKVSEDYLSFAQREEIDRFLDFGWMRNAFVADYLAEELAENGYTNGFISSYDGFSRNLDSRGTGYSQNIYDLVDGVTYPAGVMEYDGPMSIVYLRDFPSDELDSRRMYQLRNGELRTTYLSTADGRCRSAANNLICYSKMAGCGEITLQIAPVYVADTLDASALEALAESGIHSIRCEDWVVRGTDPALALTNLYENEDVRYTASLG